MRSIDEIINESRDAREVKRAVCVKMALSAMPTSQVCEMLNVSPQYVSKWRGTNQAEGADALFVSSSRQRELFERRSTHPDYSMDHSA